MPKQSDTPSANSLTPTEVALVTSLASQFDIALSHTDLVETSSMYERFRQALSQRIAHLLEHDMQRLLQIFYRIDVDETQVKRAFATLSYENLPHRLADLVIQRIEKTLAHRQQKNNRR